MNNIRKTKLVRYLVEIPPEPLLSYTAAVLFRGLWDRLPIIILPFLVIGFFSLLGVVLEPLRLIVKAMPNIENQAVIGLIIGVTSGSVVLIEKRAIAFYINWFKALKAKDTQVWRLREWRLKKEKANCLEVLFEKFMWIYSLLFIGSMPFILLVKILTQDI